MQAGGWAGRAGAVRAPRRGLWDWPEADGPPVLPRGPRPCGARGVVMSGEVLGAWFAGNFFHSVGCAFSLGGGVGPHVHLSESRERSQGHSLFPKVMPLSH